MRMLQSVLVYFSTSQLYPPGPDIIGSYTVMLISASRVFFHELSITYHVQLAEVPSVLVSKWMLIEGRLWVCIPVKKQCGPNWDEVSAVSKLIGMSMSIMA